MNGNQGVSKSRYPLIAVLFTSSLASANIATLQSDNIK